MKDKLGRMLDYGALAAFGGSIGATITEGNYTALILSIAGLLAVHRYIEFRYHTAHLTVDDA